MPAQWIPALLLSDLPPGSKKVIRKNRVQVAVFNLSDGSGLYAIDNRCPHEGYPMAEGVVKDCVVTCSWHNYKFRLSDGKCIMGEEDIRTYPVRVVDGMIEVDIELPDPAEAIPELLVSLQVGMHRFRMGQVARDVARLLDVGYDPHKIAFYGALHDAEYAEWGTSHALPIAYDVTKYFEHYPGIKSTLPLIQALEMSARSNLLRPKRSFAAPKIPEGSPEQAGLRLAQLVENEEGEEAQALVLGALKKGWARAEIEPWFYELCAQHFLDFGHALIYQQKIFDLLDLVQWEKADVILGTFIYGIVNGTRYDTLPKWKGFRAWRSELEPSLPDLYKKQKQHAPSTSHEVEQILAVLLDGSRGDLSQLIHDSFQGGVSLNSWVDAISLGASERMLRFKPSIELDVSIQNNWLDVTHLLTFSNALRTALKRFDSPSVIWLVLQGARFVHGAKGLDQDEASRLVLDVLPGTVEQNLGALPQALQRCERQKALFLVAGILQHAEGAEALCAFYRELSLDDPATRPIVATHVIKTYLAAFDEYAHLDGNPQQKHPLLALTVFLASPLRERRMGQVVHEAIEFVANGRTPKDLA